MVVLATVLLLVGTLAAYLERNVLDAGRFSDNVAEAVQSEAVSSRIADTVTSGLVARDPQLLAARPVVESAVRDVLRSSFVGGLIRRSAVETHNALFSRDVGSIVIDLANVAVVATSFLENRDPTLARRLEPETRVVGEIADRTFATDLIGIAEDVRFIAFALPLVALGLCAAAIWRGPRRRAVAAVGASLMWVGGLTFLTGTAIETVALLAAPADDRDVVRAVLRAFLGDLALWSLAIGLAGAVIAAAASSLAASVDPGGLPGRIWARVSRDPEGVGWQVGRGLAIVAAGILVLAEPAFALTVVAVAFGAYLVYYGLTRLLVVLVRPAGEPVAEEGGALRAAGRRLIAWGVGLAAILGLIVAAALVALAGDEPATAIVPSPGCNGSTVLCERRMDGIAFATVHNAHAAAPYGFLNANSDLTLTEQLDRGYRGFLIDALTGRTSDEGTIRTEVSGKTREILLDEVGADGLRAAEVLADRITTAPGTGDPSPYLCHVLCELGAIPLSDGLGEIADWLDRNPRNVLLLFIQDDITPADAEEAFAEAGLLEHASRFQPEPGRPWPTLGEMIDSGENVFVMAENNGRARGWYHRGFPVVAQDTPYANPTVASLEQPEACRPNRGRPGSPLFLVNSWVDTYPPDPRNADIVNQPEFLLDRARRCERLRDRFPNMVAIDFPGRGDPVAAADRLNGVPGTEGR